VLQVTREHGGAGGHAPGDNGGVLEANPAFGEQVDVRGVDEGVGVGVAGNDAGAVVVGVDEQDMGTLGSGCGGMGGEADREEEALHFDSLPLVVPVPRLLSGPAPMSLGNESAAWQ